MKNKIFTIAVFVFCLNTLFAQTFKSDVSKRGTTAAPFLSIGQGARAVAMGSAFAGVANDVSAVYWNPAGLTSAEGFQMMFDHTTWIADIKYNFLAASYNLGGYGAVGFSFTSSSIGDMKVTTIDQPGGTGETFSASDVAISLAYAMQLTDRFSIGINPKFIYQSIWKMNATAFAFDIGVKYITPFDDAVLAMSISNFGTKIQLLGNSNLVLHDLDPGTTGNNGKIPAYLETGAWSLPLNFRVGINYTPVRIDRHKLTVAADASHPSDDYESVNLGAEYSFNNFLFIRGGYKSLFLEDSEESFTLGFGVRQSLMNNAAILLDYAYQSFGRFSDIQKFTLSVNF
ncbi:MAG: PorV/PorQ family protein [Ignavibacteriaceae bacterium]|nr:PorV/PorQ family protein [Ignavibacteriaceae bacterium]